jgi:hypothetical protein
MVRHAPATATGEMTALTREPSGVIQQRLDRAEAEQFVENQLHEYRLIGF